MLAFQTSPQRLAHHEWHYIVERAVIASGIEERKDVRVRELGGGVDLGQEPLAVDGRGDFRVQDLDRHPPIVALVARLVNRCHAARSELALDAVAAGKGLRQTWVRMHLEGRS